MNEVYYLAGPMQGIPQFNIPMFDAQAKRLRDMGYYIINPAELDDPDTRAGMLASYDGKLEIGNGGPSWGDFLARDVKIVADECTGIFLLPGWTKSKGARLEAFVALLCGHDIVFLAPCGDIIDLESWQVAAMIVQEWDTMR